jgi:hypothetical protein
MSGGLRPLPSEFLRAWFTGCPHDQLIERRAIHAKDHSIQQAFISLDAVDDFYGAACELVDEHDVYFGVCPRMRPRGDKASVTHAPGLWCDLDFKRFEDGETGALRQLAGFTVQPTWIVATGGGYHVYWKLGESVRADAAFERRLKGLVRTLNADPAATDRSRVLRVPGTFNHKYPDCQVRLVAWPS